MPAPVVPAPPAKVGTMAAPATIIVTLPAEAKLSIDDAATKQTSARRVFVSPTLNPGETYSYTLKAEFVAEGKPVVQSKKVTVTAGNEATVSFSASDLAGVASR